MKSKALFLIMTLIGWNQLKIILNNFKQKLIIKLKCIKTNKIMRLKKINNYKYLKLIN